MNIDDLRIEIDDFDSRILVLLNERAKVVKKIGEEKKKINKPILDSDREEFVIKKIRAENKDGLLSDEQVEAVFRTIMDSSRKFEENV